MLECGVPVVYAREHDSESSPWVGRAPGAGWPIFVADSLGIPRFADLSYEPRVALANFLDIKLRAEHKIASWQRQLTRCLAAPAEGPQQQNKLRRLSEAVDWWQHFLSSHAATFFLPEGETESFVVDSGGAVRLDNLPPPTPVVPIVLPSSAQPAHLPPPPLANPVPFIPR